jgi:hypothetical protein
MRGVPGAGDAHPVQAYYWSHATTDSVIDAAAAAFVIY